MNYSVNDKVYDFEYGWGVVKDTTYPVKNFPISVLFSSYKLIQFTKDGKRSIYDINPRLSFTEYNLVTGGFNNTFPFLKKDEVVYVKNKNNDEYLKRYFSHLNYCYIDGLDSKSTNKVVKWKIIERYEK